MKKLEQLVTLFLEELGATVRRIPCGRRKTPDFVAEIGEIRYLIELKTKFGDPVREKKRKNTLAEGRIAEEQDTTERKNVISGIIADAAEQLREFDAEPVDYRLVWLLGYGRLSSLYYSQFESALYGVATIADLGPDADRYTRPCYYFHLSDFYKHRDILDGAIISTIDSGKFLLNDLGSKYPDLRCSPLAKAMATGLIDPPEKENRGEAYYIDGDVERKDARSVLHYLQKKYGRSRLMNIGMNYYACTIEVPSQRERQVRIERS